jgi:hypothetical protein
MPDKAPTITQLSLDSLTDNNDLRLSFVWDGVNDLLITLSAETLRDMRQAALAAKYPNKRLEVKKGK